jgi:hypothetical protein
LQEGRNPAAAYCFLWARRVSPDPDSLPLFPEDFESILDASMTEVPGLAELREEDAGFSPEMLAELRKRTPGRNRADRYASALGDSGWLTSPGKAEATRLTAPVVLPEGAGKVRLKSPRPGMVFDEIASEVVWENPPSGRTAERVLVFYELDGQPRYVLAVFPAAEGSQDSGHGEIPHE